MNDFEHWGVPDGWHTADSMKLESEGWIAGFWAGQNRGVFHPDVRINDGWLYTNAVGGWIPVLNLAGIGVTELSKRTDN